MLPDGFLLGQKTLTQRNADQENREPNFIYLNAGPVGSAVHLHILRPVAIGFLGDVKKIQGFKGIRTSADCHQAPDSFNQIPRPDKMVPAQIMITFRVAPWDEQAGDFTTEKDFSQMNA